MNQLGYQPDAVVILPLTLLGVIGNHDGGGIDRDVDGRASGDRYGIAIDRTGLPDVERLTVCHVAGVIHQRDFRDSTFGGELPCQRTTQFASAKDDGRSHGHYSIWMKRVCLVTGGTRGIGLAVAHAFVAQGESVAITGTQPDGARSAQEKLVAGGAPADRVIGLTCDVRDPASVERVVHDVVTRFGALDVLVNNAGVGVGGAIADMTYDEWNRIIGTNLSGVFHCCKAAIPHLRKRGGGWIFNISSLASKNPFVGGGAYCASKTALNALSEVLMQELRYDNIRVSYILPGSVATGFSGRAAGSGADWKLHAEDVARVLVDLLDFPDRSLPSRIEIRPSRPSK